MLSRLLSTTCICFIFLFSISIAKAQLQLDVDEDQTDGYNYIPSEYEQKTLKVKNLTDTTVLFNWEVVFSDSVSVFVEPQFSDLNISYLPGVNTICDMDFPNTITGQDLSYLGLHMYYTDLIAAREEIEGQTIIVNLLTYPDCSQILASIELPLIYNLSSTQDNQETSFSIYPNPIKNQFVVDHDFPRYSPYTIMGINGKIFDESRLSSNEIDVEDFPAGIYILRIIAQDKMWYSRFIKID